MLGWWTDVWLSLGTGLKICYGKSVLTLICGLARSSKNQEKITGTISTFVITWSLTDMRRPSFIMCLIIWVNEERYERGRSRIVEKYTRRFPRLASIFSRPPAPPPQYEERNTRQQSQVRPAAERPESFALPAYASYRKHVGDHIVVDVQDPGKFTA